MKTSLKALFAVAAMGASALFVQAQPAPKVAVIDLNKALESYYKTQDEQAKLQTYEASANKDAERLLNEGRSMVTKFNEARESINNPVLNDDAKKKAEADAMRISQEIQKKEQELNEFRQQAVRNIQEGVMKTRQLLIAEINNVASDIGKKKGANLVIEKGALVYADTAFDITNEVIAELNKGRPAAPAVSFPGTSGTAK